MRRLLPSIANLYLAAFAVDGLLSVVDDGGAWIGVGHPLGGVRGLVGTLVLALSSLLGLAMSATPRLPWRPLLLAVLYPSIALLLVPIPLLLSFGLDPAGTLPVGLVQIAVAADALFAVRRREGTWWLRPEDGPLFTWRHALLAAFWLGIAVPLGMTVALAGEIVAGVDIASNGFVRLTTRGVELAEHQLIRQGQRVRLVAMMHIGDQGYYEGLVEDLDEPGAIVLVEGVTDPDERIRGRLQYKRVAEALGLDTQATLRARRARVRNADVSTPPSRTPRSPSCASSATSTPVGGTPWRTSPPWRASPRPRPSTR